MHALSTIKVTAPGSIMLMGEHAVLFGHQALACAVDKFMCVTLTAREDRDVVIDSALATYQASLDTLTEDERLSFVLAAIRRFSDQLPSGFHLSIKSEFSHTVGLGSSAAVTAAVVTALLAFSGEDVTDKTAVFDHALAIVHDVQDGRGSGTDLVASVYGGLVAYRVKPREIKALSGLPPISLFYAGYKTRTPDVLRKVEANSRTQPAIFHSLYQLMNQTCEAAETAIIHQQWQELGRLMDIYQGLMEALGVCDQTLADMIWRLRSSEHICGVKISGSGLGDCVVVLGKDNNLELPYEEIPVAVSARGVEIEFT
ncbi:MAG: mevalonate kinase [Pontibacterium sp.]